MGAITFVDTRAKMRRMGTLAVVDGLATVLDGEVPEGILGMKVTVARGVTLTPADGDIWLQELARRFKGYVWAQYIEADSATQARAALDALIDPSATYINGNDEFDPAEHPRWGPGTPGGKGGEFRPKTSPSVVGGGVHVLSDEAHRLEQTLLSGAVEHVRPIDSEVDYPGINDLAMAIADIDGVQTFIKACDQDRELAAYVVNLASGGLVDMPATVIRETPDDLAWNIESYGYSPPPLAVYASKVEGIVHANPAEMNADELLDMAVFDAAIGNNDRHGGNVLTEPGKRVHAIDHGLSFQTLVQNMALMHLEARERGEWWDVAWPGQPPRSYMQDPPAGKYRLKAKHVRALKRIKRWLKNGGRKYLEAMDLNCNRGNYEGVDGMVRRINWMLRTGEILMCGDLGGGPDYMRETVDV